MSEPSLSPNARRCLWQCYSLLLRLAEEAGRNTTNSEVREGERSETGTGADELTCPDRQGSRSRLWQTELEEQAEHQIEKQELSERLPSKIRKEGVAPT
jgi:hypothetical protein